MNFPDIATHHVITHCFNSREITHQIAGPLQKWENMLTFTYGVLSPKPGVITSRSSLSSDYKKKSMQGCAMIVEKKKKIKAALYYKVMTLFTG